MRRCPSGSASVRCVAVAGSSATPSARCRGGDVGVTAEIAAECHRAGDRREPGGCEGEHHEREGLVGTPHRDEERARAPQHDERRAQDLAGADAFRRVDHGSDDRARSDGDCEQHGEPRASLERAAAFVDGVADARDVERLDGGQAGGHWCSVPLLRS